MVYMQSCSSNIESQDMIGQMISCAIKGYNGVFNIEYNNNSHTQGNFENSVNFCSNKSLSVSISFVKGNVMLVTSSEGGFEQPLYFLISYLKLKSSDVLLEYARKKFMNSRFGDAMNALCTANIFNREKALEALRMYNIIHIEKYNSIAILSVNKSGETEYVPSADEDWCFAVDILRQVMVSRRQKWDATSAILGKDEIVKPVDGVLARLSNEAIVKHINTYHGSESNSILDVALKLGHDPLVLLPSYVEWVKKGWIAPVRTSKDASQTSELRCILVVDDSPIVQSMMHRILSEQFNVASATDAVEALAILNNQKVDLIITDVTMPDIDGMEFCRTVRKINKFKNLPIIMLTSKESILDHAMGKLAGATRYLGKSANRDEILKAIEECI